MAKAAAPESKSRAEKEEEPIEDEMLDETNNVEESYEEDFKLDDD